MAVLSEHAKRQIALLAGGDLDGDEALEVRRIIESSAEHRQQWIRCCGCLDVLEKTGSLVATPDGPSLWPSIEARLRPSVVRRPEKFNGWIPALSLAAACIAVLVAGQMEGTASYEAGVPQMQASFLSGNRLHHPVVDFTPKQMVEGVFDSAPSKSLWPPRPQLSQDIVRGQWQLRIDRN